MGPSPLKFPNTLQFHMKSPLETCTNTRIRCANVGTEVALEIRHSWRLMPCLTEWLALQRVLGLVWYQQLMLDCPQKSWKPRCWTLEVWSNNWRFLGKAKSIIQSHLPKSSLALRTLGPSSSLVFLKARSRTTNSNKTLASPFPTKYLSKTLFTKTNKQFLMPEMETGKNPAQVVAQHSSVSPTTTSNNLPTFSSK